MNKLLTKVAKIALGLSLAAGVGVAIGSKAAERVDAAEEVYAEAIFTSDYQPNNSSYTGSFTNTTNGFSWTVRGFNNNSNGWNGLIKCGRKNNASTASITTSSSVDAVITKVSITFDAVNSSSFNSAKLYAGASGTTEIGDITLSTGEKVINIPSANQAVNQIYKFDFDIKSISNNGAAASVSSVKLYYNKVITYTVTYDANGGSVSPSSETKASGSHPTFPTPTKSNNTFNGWQVNGAGTYYTSANANDYTVSANVTFVASWTPLVTEYRVTYDANGGTVSPAHEDIVENGHPSLPTPTYAHHTFNGWQVNGSGSYVTNNYSVTSDVTLVANWTEDAKVSVTYDAGEGTGTDIVTNEYVGSYIVSGFPGTFTAPAGKMFSNWTSGGNDYNAGAEYTLSAGNNVVFTAQYVNAPDVINQAFTGVSGSSYANWSDKSGSSGSGAVYAGNSSAGTDIQMREQSPSGIWTTSSGGVFSGIEVTWHSSTANARSIEIYGKSTAYASADLYSDSSKGTLIGTIAKGSSTISGNLGEYEFIGIKPIGGALYLTEIKIYWQAASTTPSASLEEDEVSLYTNNSAGITAHVVVKNCDDALFEWTTSSNKITLDDEDTDTVTIKPAANATGGDATVSLTVYGTGLDEELTLTVHVIEPQPGETINNPMTVAQARDHIDGGTDENTYYVTGIVSSIVTAYDSQHHNISFNMSDDGLTTSDQLEAYRCGGTEAEHLSVGDVVIVSGQLTLYQSTTYEFAQGCTIESRTTSWVYDYVELTTEEGYDNHYYQGSTFTSDGLIVLYWEHNTATGADRSTNVTASSTFNADLTTTGTKSLTATYDGHTSSNSLTYHVIEKPEYDIAFGSASGSTKIDGASVTANDWTVTTVGTTSFTQNSAYSQVGSSSSPATSITFTKTISSVVTIKEFIIDLGGFSNTAGNVTLKVGSTTVGEGALNATSDVSVASTSYGRGTGSSTSLTITIENIAKGVKVYGIAYVAKTDAEMVSDFISEYMHMSHTTNDGSCKSEGWYVEAKAGYAKLFDEQKSLFNSESEYAAAKARLIAWAAANEETFDPAAYTFTPNNGMRNLLPVLSDNSKSITMIAIISLMSVGAIAGYFFIRKRKVN